MRKPDSIAVFVRLRACHTGNGNRDVSRRAGDAAAGHGFGDLTPNGGVGFDQLCWDTNCSFSC